MKSTILILVMCWLSACVKPTQIAQSSDPLQEIKQTVRNKFPTVRQLSTNDFAAWLKDANRPPPLILDARAPAEFAVSHLLHARNASNEQHMTEALQNHPKDQPIVAYCSVGYRSSQLAEKLMQQGFTNVANLEGSIFQWANEGRPVYKGDEQVNQVHPFDKKWGQMLKSDLWSPLP